MKYRIISLPVAKNEEICKDYVYLTKNNIRVKLLGVEAGIFCDVSTILNDVKFSLKSNELYELLLCSDDIEAGDNVIDLLTGKTGVASMSNFRHKNESTFMVDYGLGKSMHKFTNHRHDSLNIGKFICKVGIGMYSIIECFPEILKMQIPKDYVVIDNDCYCKYANLDDCPYNIGNWCNSNKTKGYFSGLMVKGTTHSIHIVEHILKLREKVKGNTESKENVTTPENDLEINPEVKNIFPDDDFNIMYSALNCMDDTHANMNTTELTGELIFRLKRLGYKIVKDGI